MAGRPKARSRDTDTPRETGTRSMIMLIDDEPTTIDVLEMFADRVPPPLTFGRKQTHATAPLGRLDGCALVAAHEDVGDPVHPADHIGLIQAHANLFGADVFDGDLLALGVLEGQIAFRAVRGNQLHQTENDERHRQQCDDGHDQPHGHKTTKLQHSRRPRSFVFPVGL